jgi:exosortase A
LLPNTLFRWPLFAWITLLAISAFVMWPSWHAMVDIWRTSETFSHGWLIFPIFIWLAFKRRDILQPVTPKPALFVSCFLAAFSLLWIFSQLVSVKVTDQFALVGIAACSFWLFFGNRVAKLMLFPLVFLFAMVPAGEGLNPILMEKTANATIWALQITGIPVYREGMNFRLPTGSWSVVEACSGLRYVIAAFILSVLFANLNYSSWRKRIGFVAICMVSAILANWVRAYTVVLVGHFSEMRWQGLRARD